MDVSVIINDTLQERNFLCFNVLKKKLCQAALNIKSSLNPKPIITLKKS